MSSIPHYYLYNHPAGSTIRRVAGRLPSSAMPTPHLGVMITPTNDGMKLLIQSTDYLGVRQKD
jgi:hypothetical protein